MTSGFLVEVGDQIEEACFAKATGFSVFFLDKIQYRRWHVNFRAPTSRDRRVLGKTACVRAFTAGAYLSEGHNGMEEVSEITKFGFIFSTGNLGNPLCVPISGIQIHPS